MRLIDADKIDFNKVFIGASEFAQDTRNAAQMLIDAQPTAYSVDKVVRELEKIKGLGCDATSCSECKYTLDCLERDQSEKVAIDKAIEIVKQGGVSND